MPNLPGFEYFVPIVPHQATRRCRPDFAVLLSHGELLYTSIVWAHLDVTFEYFNTTLPTEEDKSDD